MSSNSNIVNFNLSKCFQALSNPIRFQIYLKILEEACECNLDEHGENIDWGNCVTNIALDLEIGQPTVSNHVKELMNCGLVTSDKRGRQVYLFGNPALAHDLKDFAAYVEEEISGHK